MLDELTFTFYSGNKAIELGFYESRLLACLIYNKFGTTTYNEVCQWIYHRKRRFKLQADNTCAYLQVKEKAQKCFGD